MAAFFAALFQTYGDPADGQHAMDLYEQALAGEPLGSPDRPDLLIAAGNVVRERFRREGNPADLQRVIALYEEALALTSRGSSSRPDLLNRLGNALRERYQSGRDPVDLDRAIVLLEEALAGAPPGSIDYPVALHNVGAAMLDRYQSGRDPVDLDRAIALLEEALAGTPPGSPRRANRLSTLSGALDIRSQRKRDRDPVDLDRAIALLEEALTLTPPGSPDRPRHLKALLGEVLTRYSRTRTRADLDRAIALCEEAVAYMLPDTPDRIRDVTTLSMLLRIRYRLSGKVADVDRAIALLKETLALTPPGSSHQPDLLSALGISLFARYGHVPDVTDVDRGIEMFEEALACTRPDASDRPRHLQELAQALLVRHRRTMVLADLDRAIALLEEALALISPGSPDRPDFLSSLGDGLFDRYKWKHYGWGERAAFAQRATTGMLDPAELHEEALAMGDLQHATGDLQRAIELGEEALALIPADAISRDGYLTNLGNGLVERYKWNKNPADLDQAIALLEERLVLTPPDSPSRPTALYNLARALSERYTRTRQSKDLKQAIDSFERACRGGLDLDLDTALHAAYAWGNSALERKEWAEAVRASTYGIEASEKLVRVQLLRTGKEAWLRPSQGLYTNAAYALAQTGDFYRAAQTLEQGRARLLAQILERDRADLARLKTGAPALYERYQAATSRWQALETTDLEAKDLSGQVIAPSRHALAAAIRQTREDFDSVVGVIRQLPGYAEFLEADAFSLIQQAIADAALIYIIATPVGGLALIGVSDNSNLAEMSNSEASYPPARMEILPIWLNGLTEMTLRERMMGPEDNPDIYIWGYLGAYGIWRYEPDDAAGRMVWQSALEETTRWLWDVLMDPLVESLGQRRVSRAILIPHGYLGLLPLHAAWTEDVAAPTGRRYALDTVSFSYAANAAVLATARTIATRSIPDRLLAVDEPYPVHASPLPSSAREVEAATSHFASATVLRREKATRSRVLRALSAHSPPSVWHFSCHGTAGFAHALESGLLMANDERLTVRDLLGLRLSGIRLAVLSACETGLPGTTVLDEVIGLPTGLLQAGVAGVVASLWSVNELSTMLLLVRFYELWRDEGLTAVEALRQAQIWVRDTTNKEKADYFKGFLPEFVTNKTPVAVAHELYQNLMFLRLDQRDFAHPFHWAAFGFTGV